MYQFPEEHLSFQPLRAKTAADVTAQNACLSLKTGKIGWDVHAVGKCSHSTYQAVNFKSTTTKYKWWDYEKEHFIALCLPLRPS